MNENSVPGAAQALELFEQERSRLMAIAYRMLGVIEEAEDVVQETWLRLDTTDFSELKNPVAWLTTICTRLALDKLKSARIQRESYVGPWLPEPLASDPYTHSASDPADQLVLAESVSIGFLSILERLSAVERAVFVLREVFGVPMSQVAETVGKTEPATRQIAKRARDRVRSERPRFQPEPDDVGKLTDSFLESLFTGDLAAFTDLLTEDVVVINDGGAKYRAARMPIVGRDRVARFVTNLFAREMQNPANSAIETHVLEISGQRCLYMTKPVHSETPAHAHAPSATEPYLLVVLNWSDGKLHSLSMIRNIEKLRRVHEHWERLCAS